MIAGRNLQLWKNQAVSRWQTRSLSVSARSAEQEKLPFSIYIHWPYCESKCTYCNFNKYVNPEEPPVERLTASMIRELDHYLTHPSFGLRDRPIHSVYFGGGTPSLAPASTIEKLLNTIDTHVRLRPNTEITLEANPTSIETAKLLDFRKAGVNRLSMGIQSFNDRDLKLLGRDHTASESIRSLATARKIFDAQGLTFDLIFARPGQTLSDWQQELKQGLDIAGNHLSLYQLSMERSTPLDKLARKGLLPPLPTPDEAADMYEDTIRLTKEHGFQHYEVSNYCKTQAAISRHNFAYWQGLDFLGIGPGAHGRLTMLDQRRFRTFGEFHPEKYMALCEQEGEGIRQMKAIDSAAFMEELIVFGLRTRMGVGRATFEQLTGGMSLDKMLNKEALSACIEAGFLISDNQCIDVSRMAKYSPEEFLSQWLPRGGIRPTEAGLARMDSILPNILNTTL